MTRQHGIAELALRMSQGNHIGDAGRHVIRTSINLNSFVGEGFPVVFTLPED
jgi:hypothetical protein